MTPSFGNEIISTFGVCDDDKEFFAHMIDCNNAPTAEIEQLFEQSLMAGSQDWHAFIECAKSRNRQQQAVAHPLDGTDLLYYIRRLLDRGCRENAENLRPWEETDCRIGITKKHFEQELDIRGPHLANYQDTNADIARALSQSLNAQTRGTTSHYWVGESTADCPTSSAHKSSTMIKTNPPQQAIYSTFTDAIDFKRLSSNSVNNLKRRNARKVSESANQDAHIHRKRSNESPYFANDVHTNKKSKKTSLLRVSRLQFPPLDSPHFGLVQETLAHEPFWLLVAVTLLIQTSGKVAIPALYKIMERFPRPDLLLDADSAEKLSGMIRPMGLVGMKVSNVRTYAFGFVHSPPQPDVAYPVKNYARRLEDPVGDGFSYLTDTDTWEIGHLTQGEYALDSWRIFCRDRLLCRAQDWKGKGREHEFQPEWMRVKPKDKELRAYLRWMWMQEGWEWDPSTGEKTVLREEMRQAVNDGRVQYDEYGNLSIICVKT